MYSFGKHSNSKKFEQSLVIQDKYSLKEYPIDRIHVDIVGDDDILVMYSILAPILIFDLHSKSVSQATSIPFKSIVKVFINNKHLIVVYHEKYQKYSFYNLNLIKTSLGAEEILTKLDYEFNSQIQSYEISFNNSFFIVDLKIGYEDSVLEFWIISLMGACERRRIILETNREFQMYNYSITQGKFYEYIVEDDTILYFKQIDSSESKINFIKITFTC